MALNVQYKYRAVKPDLEQRKLEGSKTLRCHPLKVPVVIGKVNKSILPELDNFKFLFPAASKIKDIIEWINEKLRRPYNAPLYLYVDNEVVVDTGSTLSSVYQEYRDDDYYLYIAYYETLIHRTDHK